ncbi:unnamed protein product, partial [Brenthis ino]
MWRYFVLILSLIVSASSISIRPIHEPFSAASEAQIRFAIENKYDDTGPGANQPEYAYRTYKNVDDAIISYLDDPNTKLPEYEREKAISVLQGNNYSPPPRQLPKTVEEYTGYIERPKQTFNQIGFGQQVSYDPATNYKYIDLRGYQQNSLPPKKFLGLNINDNFYNVQSLQTPTLASYVDDLDLKEAHDQFNPHPKYSFSYGVHDKQTGDSKSAQEIREGDTVRGYYSFMDPDGKRRTVHYTADDKQGFRATVQRSH